MPIGIQRLVISSFFLPLSRGSIAIFLSSIVSLPTSHSCVPLTSLPLSGVLHSFARGSPRQRQQFLPLHPPLLLLLQQVEWHLKPSWHSLCAWMLALTLLVISCVRWTPVLVVSHNNRLWWVVSQWLPLRFSRHLRMRMTMAPIAMMSMRMMIMAHWMMMRCLLDVLTLCHLWQKGRVVLRWE